MRTSRGRSTSISTYTKSGTVSPDGESAYARDVSHPSTVPRSSLHGFRLLAHRSDQPTSDQTSDSDRGRLSEWMEGAGPRHGVLGEIKPSPSPSTVPRSPIRGFRRSAHRSDQPFPDQTTDSDRGRVTEWTGGGTRHGGLEKRKAPFSKAIRRARAFFGSIVHSRRVAEIATDAFVNSRISASLAKRAKKTPISPLYGISNARSTEARSKKPSPTVTECRRLIAQC
jgi:hypothetical protein